MKKVLVLLALIFTLFLSSCIKMDSSLKVLDDLTFDGTTTFDYTKFNSMANGIGSSFGTGTTTEQSITMPCTNLEEGTGGLSMGDYKEITCVNINENIAEVTGKGGSLKDVIIEKDGNYYLNLKYITDSNSKDDGQTEEEKINSINMLKSMGFEMNYSIELPTNIIDSNVGKIEDNIISFNVFDIINESTPYVIFGKTGELIENKIENTSIKMESKQYLFKKLILSKNQLEKTYKGRKDIAKYDSIIPKAKDDKLLELNDKISKIDRTNKLFKKYENLFNYLEAKIGLEIYNRKI